jgi:hypothetical protein
VTLHPDLGSPRLGPFKSPAWSRDYTGGLDLLSSETIEDGIKLKSRKNTGHNKEQIALYCGLFLIAMTVSAQAPAKPEPDVLEFNNGEKLIGHLVSASGGSVTFHSDAVGDVTADWAKIKTLKSSATFAVPEKGTILDKHTDTAKVPQGTVSVNDQKLEIIPAAGATPTVIPVANAANVVPQASFLNAFKTPKLSEGWRGSASAGIDIIAATQKYRSFNAGVALQRVVSSESWISPRYRTLLNFSLANSQFSQSGKDTIKNNIILGGIEHDMYLSRRLFAYVSADYAHSSSQGLKLAQTYAGGLGYVLLKDEHQELDVKGGIAYTRQSFSDIESPKGVFTPVASKSLIGASVGETYTRSFNHGVTLNQGFTFIPSFNDSSYYLHNSYLKLFIPVSKRFALSIGGIDAYINRPPAGFKKNSFEFLTQLSYKIN